MLKAASKSGAQCLSRRRDRRGKKKKRGKKGAEGGGKEEEEGRSSLTFPLRLCLYGTETFC